MAVAVDDVTQWTVHPERHAYAQAESGRRAGSMPRSSRLLGEVRRPGPQLLSAMPGKKKPGPSVKDDETYEALRVEGASKEKSAGSPTPPRTPRARGSAVRAAVRLVRRLDRRRPASGREIGIEGRSKMNKVELVIACATTEGCRPEVGRVVTDGQDARSRLADRTTPVLVLVVAAAVVGASMAASQTCRLQVRRPGGPGRSARLRGRRPGDRGTRSRTRRSAVVMVPLALIPMWLADAFGPAASVGALAAVVVLARRALGRPAPGGWSRSGLRCGRPGAGVAEPVLRTGQHAADAGGARRPGRTRTTLVRRAEWASRRA